MNNGIYMMPGNGYVPRDPNSIYSPNDSRLWGGWGWGFRPWGFGFGGPFGFGMPFGFGVPFGFGFGFPFFI